ncbi:hypothetical protein A2U01_0106288, partial [Trifolium medium]|nr:hypothetical protein [Trifolium medium]
MKQENQFYSVLGAGRSPLGARRSARVVLAEASGDRARRSPPGRQRAR